MSIDNKNDKQECRCKDASCAKCLFINCKDETCQAHTKEMKEDFKKRYDKR